MALAHEADGVVQHSAYLCGVVSVDDEHERGLHELIGALVGAFLKSQKTAASCDLGILNDIIYVLFRVELLRHEHQLEALAQTREVAQRIGSDKAAYRATDGDCKRRRVDEPVHLTALEDTENDHAECDDPANYNRDIQNDPSLFKFYRSFLLRLVYVMSKARRSLPRTVCRSVCAACCIREFYFGVPSCFHARCRYAHSTWL